VKLLAALALALAAFIGPAAASDEPGDFSFYVLALSWSPSFCAMARQPDRGECGQPHGFIVHGLWPQDEHRSPRYCSRDRGPTRAAMRRLRDLMPDPGLIVHEWREHGTCSGLEAEDYFATLRAAAARVKRPAIFARPEAPPPAMSPAAVETAFIAANPGLQPGMIAVACKGGRLSEVRVCLGRDLAFHACPEVDRRACRAERIVVPPAKQAFPRFR
jgi:ribonuclease T2